MTDTSGEIVRWWAGSGGGSAGSAWHAGYLKRRAEAGIEYAGAAGVSSGALGALAIVMFYALTDSAAYFERLALRVTTDDVHRRHFPLGKLHALWRGAWRDAGAFRELCKAEVDGKAARETGKLLRLGITALTEPPGEMADRDEGAPGAVAYFTLDESYVPLWQAAYASSALPGIFEPAKIQDRWCVDGGVQVVTPVAAAIEAGAMHIDVSIAEPPTPRYRPTEGMPKTIDVLLRSLELAVHRLTWVDLRYTQRINDLVQARHPSAAGKRFVHLNVSHPTSPLNDDAMIFDPKEAAQIALRAYEAALALEVDAEYDGS